MAANVFIGISNRAILTSEGPLSLFFVPLFLSLPLSFSISYNPKLRHSVNDVSFPVIAYALC